MDRGGYREKDRANYCAEDQAIKAVDRIAGMSDNTVVMKRDKSGCIKRSRKNYCPESANFLFFEIARKPQRRRHQQRSNPNTADRVIDLEIPREAESRSDRNSANRAECFSQRW